METIPPPGLPHLPTSPAGAFVKGGCGCLLLFIVVGLCCVMIGGHMHIDIFGAFFIFLIGGIIGLVVLWAYNKGRSDAGR